MNETLSAAWVMKVATVIKDNFTMADILSLTNTFAAGKDIEVRYSAAPEFINKQNVAQQNLSTFSISQTIQFLTEIVDSETGYQLMQLADLLKELVSRFPNHTIEKDREAVGKMKTRFEEYPQVAGAWTKAGFQLSVRNYREAVVNCRLALELLLKQLFNNEKSLENQKAAINELLSEQPKEFTNMLISQIRSYEVLQNQHFKHNLPDMDEMEVRYIFNTTYLIMDYLEKKAHDK
ncbi:TPA: hypothetical protein ACIECS_001249 [Enterococcus faecium]